MSYDRRYTLTILFREIIRLSHRTEMMREAIEGGGYPLHSLVSIMCQQRTLADVITDDCTGESHEFRLNEAGLKLYWRLDRKFDVLKIRIGGDQAAQYPFFTAAVQRMLGSNNIR